MKFVTVDCVRISEHKRRHTRINGYTQPKDRSLQIVGHRQSPKGLASKRNTQGTKYHKCRNFPTSQLIDRYYYLFKNLKKNLRRGFSDDEKLNVLETSEGKEKKYFLNVWSSLFFSRISPTFSTTSRPKRDVYLTLKFLERE